MLGLFKFINIFSREFKQHPSTRDQLINYTLSWSTFTDTNKGSTGKPFNIKQTI